MAGNAAADLVEAKERIAPWLNGLLLNRPLQRRKLAAITVPVPWQKQRQCQPHQPMRTDVTGKRYRRAESVRLKNIFKNAGDALSGIPHAKTIRRLITPNLRLELYCFAHYVHRQQNFAPLAHRVRTCHFHAPHHVSPARSRAEIHHESKYLFRRPINLLRETKRAHQSPSSS